MTATAARDDLWIDFLEDGLVGLRGRDPDPTDAQSTKSWATPGELARDLDPTTRQTPALDAIDAALVDVDNGSCDRLIITMPPQEGKTTRVKAGVLWMMLRNRRRRIVAVSYGKDLAIEFGRDVRSWITSSTGVDGAADLGVRIARDNGSVSSWTLDGHRGGLRSVGLGGGITGRPADVMVIDDPIKNREEADSEVYRAKVQRYWTSTLSTRLAPGAPVIVILTRWHEDDLAGWLLKRPDGDRWRVVNIPACADHDPAKGETDLLGREPGEYMLSARVDERTGQPRTPVDWEQIRVQVGSRDWEALYQGNPSPPEGNIIRRDWWRYYDVVPWVVHADGAREIIGHHDGLMTSWDLTFKDTKGSDYVVGQVWMRRGANAYLLEQVRGRWSFTETCRQMVALSARWPQVLLHVVEDKANGPAVMAALRSTIPGLVPEEPQGSKLARLSAASPLVEAGNVWLPDPKRVEGSAWVGDFVEEIAGFPTARNDDQADSFSQAMNRLFLQPLLTEARPVYAPEYEVIDRRGWYASPV